MSQGSFRLREPHPRRARKGQPPPAHIPEFSTTALAVPFTAHHNSELYICVFTCLYSVSHTWLSSTRPGIVGPSPQESTLYFTGTQKINKRITLWNTVFPKEGQTPGRSNQTLAFVSRINCGIFLDLHLPGKLEPHSAGKIITFAQSFMNVEALAYAWLDPHKYPLSLFLSYHLFLKIEQPQLKDGIMAYPK